MNNPETLPVDVLEQRAWLNAHKAETGLPWSQIAPKIGVPMGTLTPFASDSYKGDCVKIAQLIYRYRQLLISQAEIAVELPEPPGYFETPTGRRIQTMLSIAQRGRITVVAGGPGTSKTQTIRHYQASVPNVWVATMSPSTSGLNTMQIAMLEAMGDAEAKGTPLALSRKIKSIVKNTGGLLVLDEAQHLGEKGLEEARSWHDATGIGMCLVGNEDTLLRLTLSNKRDAFARLASRVAQRLIFRGPTEGDALALADAWAVQPDDMRAFLVTVAKKPGGLRTCTMVMETATMLAVQDRQPLALGHLHDAWTHLSYQQVAA
jgi:DNA transposition AAA+ family ATPase